MSKTLIVETTVATYDSMLLDQPAVVKQQSNKTRGRGFPHFGECSGAWHQSGSPWSLLPTHTRAVMLGTSVQFQRAPRAFRPNPSEPCKAVPA
jgi:hypothetical protein